MLPIEFEPQRFSNKYTSQLTDRQTHNFMRKREGGGYPFLLLIDKFVYTLQQLLNGSYEVLSCIIFIKFD